MSYPLDYSIQDLNLLGSNGQKFNLKRMMTTLSYYEDLYSFSSSGSLVVSDASGFIESLQLTGNEFLIIDIGKVKDAPDNTIETFRLYKITKRKPSADMNSESYELCFCSEEMFLSEQIKISKSYPGMMIKDVITDIVKNQLQVNSDKINKIESTTGIYDFVVPNMKPFEAISWISTYAQSDSYPGADMLFYQTREGFNFRSLQSIYNESVYATYKYSLKNAADSEQSTEDKQLAVQKFEFVKTYDSLNEINSGTFSNRLISIDPLIRSFYVTDFDYTQYAGNSLNGNPPSNYLTNRLGDAQNAAFAGVLKVAASNKAEMDAQYISDRSGSVAHDIEIETYVPLRTAQISLANYTKLKLTIPGDTGLTVGKTIQFNMNSLDPGNPNKEQDKFYSGKYIVTALRHMYSPDQFQTMIEIAKDSSPTQFQSINTSSDFQDAITA